MPATSTGSVFQADYPWIKAPLICCAPMRLIATAPLACEVSKAGGLGFLGSGNDQTNLAHWLEEAKERLQPENMPTNWGTLPIGIGFINWGADLSIAIPLIRQYRPAAIWLFAPRDTDCLVQWTRQSREATDGATKIWIQVGSVKDAVDVCAACEPDVLVLQGADAGGHGLNQGCSIITLIPEVIDRLASAVAMGELKRSPLIVGAGGLVDGRGVAAALALGAHGAAIGTRYLAAEEANIARGYQLELVRASDGGQTTIRSGVYDTLRGTTEWPAEYGGRGVVNQSYRDYANGMSWDENKRLYEEATKLGDQGWGPDQRMTTYAGTGVGLIRKIQSAATITTELRDEAVRTLKKVNI